jgi:hypothetical protein
MASKICSRCKKELPATTEFFCKSRNMVDGLYPTCKICRHEQYLEKVKNPRFKYLDRNSKYIRKYGISIEEYNMLLEKQGGVCAICRQPETIIVKGVQHRLTVDHNHETGKVRGLVCHRCNNTLGWYKDKIETFTNFVLYLREDD